MATLNFSYEMTKSLLLPLDMASHNRNSVDTNVKVVIRLQVVVRFLEFITNFYSFDFFLFLFSRFDLLIGTPEFALGSWPD